MCHFDSFKCFRNWTNLVKLNEDRITTLIVNTFLESFCICYKEVITNKLNLVANLCCKKFPAFPVFFVKSIFYRYDRIFLNKLFPMLDKFCWCKLCTCLWKNIFTLLFAFPFAGGCVHSNHKILAWFITCIFNSFQNVLNSFFIACKVRSETAFIANRCCKTLRLEKCCECVKNFCTPTECFFKAWSTNRHNHKFLNINCVSCMSTTIENVHHRNRKTVAWDTAKESIKWNIHSCCCCSCCCNRNRKNGVSTKIRLILCAVSLEHSSVNCINIRSIKSLDSIVYNCIYIIYCLRNTFAEVSWFIAISKL